MTALLALYGLAALAGHVEAPPDTAPTHVIFDSPTQQQAWHALERTEEWACMDAIFAAESGWNPDGVGDSTIGGSVGLGQRHIPVWGDPRPWTVAEQVAWFTSYAEDRYGGWCEAREVWEERPHAVVDGRMVGGWW